MSLQHFYKTKRQITYRGFEVTVFPGVFVPRQISKVGGISPKNIRMYQGKDVLDMGSGTGIQSLIAFRSGAKSIVSVDINPQACRNSEHNLSAYKVRNFAVRESDLFQHVPERFDSIVAYLPSMDAPSRTMSDRAVYDPGFETFRRFLENAKSHLKEGGVIYACWVNVENSIAVLNEMIRTYEYKITRTHMIPHEDEEWWMLDIAPE
jgi:methylase of polypeptide subunit release factors